jgi:hypothetical protein
MSNFVGDIIDAMEASIATSLPTFNLLKNKYDVEKNNNKQNSKRYGVIALGADQNQEGGTLGSFLLDHTFQIILTESYVDNQVNDERKDVAVQLLFDSFDTVMGNLFANKMGLSFVRNIPTFSIENPEFSTNGNVAIFRGNVVVQYSKRFNC